MTIYISELARGVLTCASWSMGRRRTLRRQKGTRATCGKRGTVFACLTVACITMGPAAMYIGRRGLALVDTMIIVHNHLALNANGERANNSGSLQDYCATGPRIAATSLGGDTVVLARCTGRLTRLGCRHQVPISDDGQDGGQSVASDTMTRGKCADFCRDPNWPGGAYGFMMMGNGRNCICQRKDYTAGRVHGSSCRFSLG